jgi:hypothetical protein
VGILGSVDYPATAGSAVNLGTLATAEQDFLDSLATADFADYQAIQVSVDYPVTQASVDYRDIRVSAVLERVGSLGIRVVLHSNLDTPDILVRADIRDTRGSVDCLGTQVFAGQVHLGFQAIVGSADSVGIRDLAQYLGSRVTLDSAVFPVTRDSVERREREHQGFPGIQGSVEL